jgi:hypothetical protein
MNLVAFFWFCFPLASTNEREHDTYLCGSGLFHLT